MRPKAAIGLGIILTTLTYAAPPGGFAESFEAMTPNQPCTGAGWEAWSGKLDACARVAATLAHSGEQALRLIGADVGCAPDDLVRQVWADKGRWTFRAMTYVPRSATGRAAIMLLNHYPASAPHDWSVMVTIDADNSIVQLHNGETLPLVRGAWVEVRVEIDLCTDRVDVFYNDEQLALGMHWTRGIAPGGAPAVAAVNLYAFSPGARGASGFYVDDISLAPAGRRLSADVNGDGAVDKLDMARFRDLLRAGDAQADFSGDGVVNAIDAAAFMDAFAGEHR